MWTKSDALRGVENGTGCLGKAANDEPVFILRGQDAMMAKTVEFWADEAAKANKGHNEKIVEAYKFAEEVRQWQAEHGCKVPD